MATEYRLSYTAAEIDERLEKVVRISDDVDVLHSDVGIIQDNVGILQTDVQRKIESVELTASEFEALGDSIDKNTLYRITDDDEENYSVLYTEQTLTEDQQLQARTNIGIIEAGEPEALELLAELEIAAPVTDGDVIYTDEQNNILII